MPQRSTSLEGPAPLAGEVLLDEAGSGLTLSAGGWSISRRRLTGGLSEGVEVVELNNGRMVLSVLPTRGMGIWKARSGETPLEWKSPVRGPVHPAFVNLTGRGGLGWLDGFDELLCRCGLAFNGPPGDDVGARNPVESAVTLHGRSANLPAHSVSVSADSDGAGRLFVSGLVDESALFGPQLRLRTTISTPAGRSEFTVQDDIENLGGTPAEVELLYHFNVGTPLLGANAVALVPAAAIVPRDARAAEGVENWATYLGPTAGYAEQVYFFEPKADVLGNTLAVLVSSDGMKGVGVAYNVRELPRFTLWKCTQAEQDGYVTGLEPGTNYPNFKSYERDQRRVLRLAPGGRYSARVTISLYETAEQVAQAKTRVQELQGSAPAILHRTPQPGWSSAGDA